jgi:cation-transporting ATPase 13A3/4/5
MLILFCSHLYYSSPPFSTMTQSVIIQRGEERLVFVKGSPEAISKICLPSSLPNDFADHTRHSARNGIYQLAMARATYTSTKDMSEVQRSGERRL